METDRTHDFAINDGDQNVIAFSTFNQIFANRFDAAVWQLKRVADDLWRCVTLQ